MYVNMILALIALILFFIMEIKPSLLIGNWKRREKIKKRKKKEKITLESVDDHLKEKLKNPKFAKIYYAEKAKLKAEMRLEEILKRYITKSIVNNEILYIKIWKKDILKVYTKILKEFVYKDSLPSVKKLWDIICDYFKNKIIKDSQFMKKVTYLDLKELAKAIRKLIEGKK